MLLDEPEGSTATRTLTMEIGSITRPSPPSASNALQRTETFTTAGAAKTELPPEASVQQVRESAAVRVDIADNAAARAALDKALRETIERHIDIDPKTREVVDQTVDRLSGEVIRQVPDQALLRLRAYARELRDRSEARDAEGRRVEKVA
jgi:flagellar protein FlaG